MSDNYTCCYNSSAHHHSTVPITATTRPSPETSTTPAPLPASPITPDLLLSQQNSNKKRKQCLQKSPLNSSLQKVNQERYPNRIRSGEGGSSTEDVSQTVVLAGTNTHYFAYIQLLPSFH